MFSFEELNSLRRRAEKLAKGSQIVNSVDLLFDYLELIDAERKCKGDATILPAQFSIFDKAVPAPVGLDPIRADIAKVLAEDKPAEIKPIAPLQPLTDTGKDFSAAQTAQAVIKTPAEDVAPERVEAMPSAAPVATVGDDGLLRGSWEEDEMQLIVKLLRDKATVQFIANELGRPKDATAAKIKSMRKSGKMDRLIAALDKDATAEPKMDDAFETEAPPRAAVATPQPAPSSPDPEPYTRRTAYPAERDPEFSAADDLAIMEGVFAGTKIDQVAAKMKRSVDACGKRARLIITENPGIDGRARILRALRFHRDADALREEMAAQ